MSEFKGTAYQWAVGHDGCSVVSSDKTERSIVSIQTICTINTLWASKEEVKANSLLISKAPEMLEMLKRALQTLKDIDSTLAHHNHDVIGWHLNGDSEPIMSFFNGMDMGVIQDAEELIKSATEI